MNRTRFSLFLRVGVENLRAYKSGRTSWQGNPLREHRMQIEAELARMDRDIAEVRALLAAAALPAAPVPAPAPSPAPATPA